VGWSKTYLQLTHTTSLTKHKPKEKMKKKKKKEAKTGSALKKKKQNNGVIFFFSSNEVCKIYDEEICRLLRRRQ
jgi:hypothetical protein